MNNDILRIVEEYKKYGEVSDLRYRGKLRYYCANRRMLDDVAHEGLDYTTYFSSDYIPAWSFILTTEGKRYRFVIAKNDGIWVVFPGKSFCWHVAHTDYISDREVRQNISAAVQLNHFTPHPTCRVVKGD